MKNTIGVALALLTISGTAAAQSGTWLTDDKSHCRVWMPYTLTDETAVWQGGCDGGNASGRGTFTLYKGSKWIERYDGEFSEGKLEGRGTTALSDGGHYDGNFKNGAFEGEGTLVTGDGMRWEGGWKDGKMNGRGKAVFPDGMQYVGEFRDYAWNGFGILTYPSGARYEGNYLENRPHGQGTYKASDGTIYDGQWSNGCFHDGKLNMHLGATAAECGIADWVVHATTEKLDGSSTVLVMTYSVEKLPNSVGREERGSLTFRCKSNVTEVMVRWPNFLGSNAHTVRWRVDDSPIQTDYWSGSQDGTAMFGPSPIAFAQRLLGKRELIVNTAPYNKSAQLLSFLIGDFEAKNLIPSRCLPLAARRRKRDKNAGCTQVAIDFPINSAKMNELRA